MPINRTTLSKYKNDVFVETGSHVGRCIDTALEVGFKEIHSVELSAKFYIHCRKKFKDDKRVFLYHGDSSKKLCEMLQKVKHRLKTLWLDAHFSGGTTSRGDKDSPLMEELDVIKYYYRTGDIILIDDIRGFKERSKSNDFDIEDIKDKLLSINPDFKFSYEDSYQGDDLFFVKDILVAK